MVWSTPSRIRAVTTAGRGYLGIIRGTTNRAPTTTRNTTVAVAVMCAPFNGIMLTGAGAVNGLSAAADLPEDRPDGR
jgi:hypothetical protein